jgi:hypothetical protein
MDHMSWMLRDINRNTEGLVEALNGIQKLGLHVDHEHGCVELVPGPLCRNTVLLMLYGVWCPVSWISLLT